MPFQQWHIVTGIKFMHMQSRFLRPDMRYLQGWQLLCFGNHDCMRCQHHVSGRCLNVLFQQHCSGVVHMHAVWVRILCECRVVHTVHGIRQHQHACSQLLFPVRVCAWVLLCSRILRSMPCKFILRCRLPDRMPE